MARWLLDCKPLCGHPWQLGVATEDHEREQAFRLRCEVFFREEGYGPGPAAVRGGRDFDEFDEWCDQLVIFDTEANQLVGTCRAILGAEAVRRGGFYGAAEFDLTPLEPIAAQIIQGSRTCVAPNYRSGTAISYLSYGMELLAREYNCGYFLGAESFRADNIDMLNTIHSYVARYCMDPDWFVNPQPVSRVEDLQLRPVTPEDKRLLPAIIRFDLHVGFLACSAPAWDPEFGCYDILMMGRRDRMTRMYWAFIERIERKVPYQPPAGKPPRD